MTSIATSATTANLTSRRHHQHARRSPARQPARATRHVVRVASDHHGDESIAPATRRAFLNAAAAAAIGAALPTDPARADDGITFKNPSPLGDGFLRYFGEATTSSSYGGYGGNENNFDKFKYYYEIPEGWVPDTVNKVEKSTNGTDSRWVNPKNKDQKVYCVTLTGYNKLKEDRTGILGDLALSDYNLQDALTGADSTIVNEREENGQTYVDFDLLGYFGAIYATVTVYGGRVYALFSICPESLLESGSEQAMRMRKSFGTIAKSDEQTQYDMEFYRRS